MHKLYFCKDKKTFAKSSTIYYSPQKKILRSYYTTTNNKLVFKPITGGSVEEIQGLKCHIPKVGYIYDYHTNKYENVGVIRRAITPEYQYWERDKDFDKVRDWELECKKKGIDRSEHQEYSDFIKKCWRYRLGGCWFSNNGVPTYITGKNWFFLSCYSMDIGYPKYRDIDRQYFYIVDWAFENSLCYGVQELTKRRCFAKDTKILMYNGASKAVQDIIVGDKVMGDDSTARNVLRTTDGVDWMYKITTENGETFTCNMLHKLYCVDDSNNEQSFDAWDYYMLDDNEKSKYYQVYIDESNQKVKVKFKIDFAGEGSFYGFTLDGNNRFLLHGKIICYNCGKSFRSGCVGLEIASRTDNFNVGIQSKSDTDAEKFFKKNIINAFRKFPPFFKPETNLPASGKAPVGELKFENSKMLDEGDELSSLIDFQSSTMGAYDGQKLGLYIADEAGKVLANDINDRWDIIKFCLKDDEGKIIGKSIHTSTVEKEKNKKGVSKQDEDTCDKNFLRMWNRSNQYEPEPDGSTKSGMVRFFMSARFTRNIDKYGFANEKAAIDAIMREREKEKDNPRALANLIRKEPLTEREAFQVDGDNCVFGNPVMLQQRYDDLLFLPKQYKVGNFHWEHGIRDGAVYFEECEGGRFMVAHEPPEGQRNLTIKRSYSYVPNNKENYVAGIDPVDYKVVSSGTDKRMSFPSLSIVKKIDPVNTTRYDNNLVCLYLFRPQLPETFYEDCVKALKYYGCEALIERNKGNIITYFEEQGYAEYAAWMEGQNERGIYNTSRESGGGINGKITEIIDQWTESGVDGCMFPILLEQLLIFDPTNTTKFDAAMSFGYALMLLKKYVSRQKRAEKNKASTDISGWFG